MVLGARGPPRDLANRRGLKQYLEKNIASNNIKFVADYKDAFKDAEAIFNCSVSFQKREKGLEAQVKMPDVPGPESLISEYENRKIISRKLRIKKEARRSNAY